MIRYKQISRDFRLKSKQFRVKPLMKRISTHGSRVQIRIRASVWYT